MVVKSKTILVGGSLLFGVVLSLGLFFWRKRKNPGPKFPAHIRWQPIGTLKNLFIYPIKSGGSVELDGAECTEQGLVQVNTPINPLRDRSFAVYREDTLEIIVCMTYPIMVSIKISAPFGLNSVILKCKDKPDLEVKLPTPRTKDLLKSKMWTGEMLYMIDCGNEVADWITDVIKGDKDSPGKLRLGYSPLISSRLECFKTNYNSRGVFQNYTSYMLMTSSSFKHIVEELPDEFLTFKQFRPNFFIETDLDPYSERNWLWLKIGEEATFMKIKDCKRCCQININPETSKYNKKQEPLKTIKKYWQKENQEPLMGICMGLYKAGKVQIGDPVYIISET